MRICRYADADADPTGAAAYGVVVEGPGDHDVVHALQGDPFDAGNRSAGAEVGPAGQMRLLAPVAPSKVVCVGRNYYSLLTEQGRDVPDEPFVFLKASTAVVGPGDPILHPRDCTDVAHEGELAAVIGRTCTGVRRADALAHVLGYTLANDITVRDWQDPNAQWWRAKSSDSHCPLGPWIETDLPDPHDVRVRTYVGDELRQDGSTSDLVFDVPTLIERVSAHMTLLPGDVLLTGTPAGIRPIRPGDRVRVVADGLGSLSNDVQPWPA